ncbi:hypothetical protein RHGRI_016350 [Rhododendron griersonianum]|uniref:Uncharacterized protein n=1 Tax=Rhododendron griersonianum TaxID=479676 RepID=A0AAV6JTU7_9ERIC|nr:hypothetical protein RHGRI_016350 [Rhododendron griersonianum]
MVATDEQPPTDDATKATEKMSTLSFTIWPPTQRHAQRRRQAPRRDPLRAVLHPLQALRDPARRRGCRCRAPHRGRGLRGLPEDDGMEKKLSSDETI